MWLPQRGGQFAAFEADWVDILAYAGERGGGKSSYQVGWQEDGAIRYGKAHRGIMTRKTYPELEQLQLEAMKIFPQSGATFHAQPSARFPVSNCWYWPNGAQTRMRYIETEQDYLRYHGHQFSRVSLDEVTEYASPKPLLMLLSTLRSEYGIPCQARLTGNPGGIGHVWMKLLFKIMELPERTPFTDKDSELVFMFIRSVLDENAALPNRDQYRRNLIVATRGNEPLRKAWIKGDWNVVAGAFFSEWDEDRHVVKPFPIPHYWHKFTSHDWGSAKPFSSAWYAIVPETTRWKNHRGDRITLPRGAIVRYREFYGMREGDYNVGLKWTIEKWSDEVMRRMGDDKMEYNVADPSMFKEDGGPSLAERAYEHSKLALVKGDNTRVTGWNQCRYRLDGDGTTPMFFAFSDSMHFRRTVPALQHDKLKIEDVDSDGEDHIGDEWRYACMSRPMLRQVHPGDDAPTSELTFDKMMQLTDQSQRSKSKYRA